MELTVYPVETKNIMFAYNSNYVLKDINLKIFPGKITTILGPNGSGKSTLLKVILGLLAPKSGQLYISGHNINELSYKQRAQKMAYVPQNHNAVFSWKVKDLVSMGRNPHMSFFSNLSDNDYNITYQSLERLSIEDMAERSFKSLSGGEQQLVLIARALAQEVEILIMDEPATGLDYANQVAVLRQLKRLAQAGITCIKTTHSPDQALWISDQTIFLKNGQVTANGETVSVITSESLSELYGIPISIIKNKCSSSKAYCCMPVF